MKIKKMICALLVFVMAVTMVACGSDKVSEESVAQEENNEEVRKSSETTAEETAGERFKVGFAYLPPTDALSASFRKALEYAASELGCEMVYAEITTGTDEETLACYENLIQAGCQGVICISTPASAVELFNQNGVYFCGAAMEIADENIKQMCIDSPYFCGNICEFEYLNGYSMAEALYNAGSKNIAYIAPAPGWKAQDDRVRGIEDFIEEHSDLTLVVGSRGDASDYGEATEQILISYPELDGIICTSNNPSVTAAIYASGRQDSVKYATCDLSDDTREQLEEGLMVYVSGGQSSSMELAFAMLYNGLTGTGNIIPKEDFVVNRGYIVLNNAEDYDNYVKYIESGEPVYSGEELKQLCGVYNPEATMEELYDLLVQYCTDFSLEDVIARHS